MKIIPLGLNLRCLLFIYKLSLLSPKQARIYFVLNFKHSNQLDQLIPIYDVRYVNIHEHKAKNRHPYLFHR